MSSNFKKNLKELYSKKQDNSFFQEFAEKHNKTIPSKNSKQPPKYQGILLFI